MEAAQVVYAPSLADIRPQSSTSTDLPVVVVPKLGKVSSHGALEKLTNRLVPEAFVEGYLVIGDFDIIAKIKSLNESRLEYYYCLSRQDGNSSQYIRVELDEQPFILDGRVSQYNDNSSRPKVQYGPWQLTFLNKLQSKFGQKWQYAQIGSAICSANQVISRRYSLDPNNEVLDPKRWIKWDIH